MTLWNQIDERFFHVINGISSTIHLDTIAKFLSSLVTWWSVAILVLVIALILKKKTWLKTLFFCALSVGATDATCAYLLKPSVQRLRPCHQNSVFLRNGSCGSQYGMPSNHAANGAAVVVSSWGKVPFKISILISSFAFLVGWSRIHLGVHYPGDILVGWCTGALISWAVLRLLSKFKRIC